MRILWLAPWIPASFLFYGLWKHADPFEFYYMGALLMILAATVSWLIWEAK